MHLSALSAFSLFLSFLFSLLILVYFKAVSRLPKRIIFSVTKKNISGKITEPTWLPHPLQPLEFSLPQDSSSSSQLSSQAPEPFFWSLILTIRNAIEERICPDHPSRADGCAGLFSDSQHSFSPVLNLGCHRATRQEWGFTDGKFMTSGWHLPS